MRLLGIDYGSKHVGVALSDEEGRIAFPREVLLNDGSLLDRIEKIATSETVSKIVIGHSLDREGEPNPIHEDIEGFIGNLTLRLGIPIELEPEHYTTQEAMRTQKKSEQTDASAAAIILNSYILRTKNKP